MTGAIDAYLNPEKTGKRVVVLGGGLVGVELGIFLSGLGRKVTIIEMLPELNFGENFLHGKGLGYQIIENGIETVLSAKAVEITKKGVLAESPDKTVLYEADTVIYAVGQRPALGGSRRAAVLRSGISSDRRLPCSKAYSGRDIGRVSYRPRYRNHMINVPPNGKAKTPSRLLFTAGYALLHHCISIICLV